MALWRALLLTVTTSAAGLACSGTPASDRAATQEPEAVPEAVPEEVPGGPEPVAAATPDPPPEAVAPDPTPGLYRELASVGRQTCGLRQDGHIRCWSALVGWTAAVADGVFEHLGHGMANVCGITADGAVGCPAEAPVDPMAQNGQIGIPAGGPFAALGGGSNFRCGLEQSGAIRCSGGNPLMTPTPPEGAFVAMAAGGFFVCGLSATGRVSCSTADGPDVQLPGGPFSAIAAGDGAVCGLRRDDGGVDCSARAPGGDTDATGFTQIAVGTSHRCGLRDGQVHCWGLIIDPSHFPPPEERAIAVTVGNDTCLLRQDGTVGCWDTDGANPRMP